ncbi:MAG TPA: diguanylate cyclase [Syntrophomonadaceae bacterium]|nr:diguanylate cyclase [Syntrophomonadaceae bacterium]
MSNGAQVKRRSKKPLSEAIPGKDRLGTSSDLAAIDGRHIKGVFHLSDEKYFKAFQSNPDPISITTIGEGRYLEVNDAFLEASGYKRDEVIGRTALELHIWLSQQDRNYWVEHLREQGYVCRGNEIRFRGKYGETRTFLFSTEIIDVSGKPHLLWVTKDITDRKRIEEALRSSEDKFSKAFNASPTPLCISTLTDGRFIAVNDGFCNVIGYSQEELLGRTSFHLGCWFNPADRQKMIERITRKEPVREVEIYFRPKFDEQRMGLYSVEEIQIDGQACLLSILTDITHRKQAEEEIKYLSFHDKLTGLYNRAYFEEELKRMDAESQLPISLIMGDVNGLKLINDALGHQEGDNLLIGVACILKESCRQEDIVARWGGDEFIILLPGCDMDDAVQVSERIKTGCKGFDTLPIPTSISLGMATKSVLARDVKEIIKEAEDKMYRNKLLEDRSTRSSFPVSLQRTLWTRSHETEAHCRRMQEMALRIGQAIGLPDSELDNLRLLAVLHDIGKIAIANSILDKPGKLTPEEWDTIKKHPEIGYRIALSSVEMAPIAEVILHHHERWDGTGYPLGIRGNEIPLLSRIIAIADSYDVMINGRPYQEAVSQEKAWCEIARCAGSQFDPDLVRKTVVLFAG